MIARELIPLPPMTQEVAAGLLQRTKSLPCKLFYDNAGSALFEEITGLPEYYLTRSELAILRNHAAEMVLAAGLGITVVELGSGTAAKTCTLLQALSGRQMQVSYFPVDISPAALAEARERVKSRCPQVSVRPVMTDFTNGLSFLRDISGRKLVLYLGSSIGNFDRDAAHALLSRIRRQLAPGDALLLGTDLVKDASILVPAYDDAQGVTEQFNKNILRRVNREMGANFDPDLFRHVALWNPEQSRMEIYLQSLRAQAVHLGLLNLYVKLAEGERIHTENSYKYTIPMVRNMLQPAGFGLPRTWYDEREWFAVHLARVA